MGFSVTSEEGVVGFSPSGWLHKVQQMQQGLAARKEVLAVLISEDDHAYNNTISLGMFGGWAGFPRPVS